jgi:mRNA interferase MazF
VDVVTTTAAPQRGEVHLVALDPTLGSEIRKTRPCVIVSPDELNLHLRTAIIAPMTTGGQAYPWRIPCRFQQRAGFVALDQLRTVDRERLVRRLGRLTPGSFKAVLEGLQTAFSE